MTRTPSVTAEVQIDDLLPVRLEYQPLSDLVASITLYYLLEILLSNCYVLTKILTNVLIIINNIRSILALI